MTLPTRPIRFTPMKIDGSGAPTVVAIGWYLVEPTRAYDDGTGRVEKISYQIDIAGVSVTKDLAVTPVDYSWVWKVTGKFPDRTQPKGFRTTEEYVAIPAGSGTLDFEDLVRIDPATLGPVSEVTPAIEARIVALETAAPPSGGASTVGGITDMAAFQKNLALNGTDAGAHRGLIGAAAANDAALTGIPTAPTAAANTNTTQLATTAFADRDFAKKVSPAFTGTPTVPTAAAGTNTTQAASTAFVTTNFISGASANLTGTPTAPTATVTVSSTQIASTAFVKTVSADATYGPANSSLTVACTGGTGGMVARPTTRSDVIVYWKCPNPPVGGGAPNAINGVDIWLKVVP